MGRLDRLELSNFKSYGGHVVVGPFKSFTAIIGTNGSGKSNLMDAISFVLGVRTSQLRGNQLRDLVYRNLEDPSDDPSSRKAYVKLVYQTASDEATTTEIDFMRSVTLGGSSEYRVRGNVVSLEKYNSELARIGVLVKARNFLVFQNEVESIASKSPKQLSAMFEEVSESAEYRVEYEQARAEKETAEDEVTHFWRKRKGMAAERRQYREQKEEAERFRRLQQEISDTKTEKTLYELFHVDEDLRNVKREARYITDELEELQRQFAKKESALKSEKKKIAILDKEKSKLERKKKRLADETEKLRPSEAKFEAEDSALTRRIKREERSLEEAMGEFEKGSDAVHTIEAGLRECTEEIRKLEQEITEAEEASASAESMAEYRSLKEMVATRTAVLQQEVARAKQSAGTARGRKDSLEARQRELQSRRDTIGNQVSAVKKRIEELASAITSAEQEVTTASQEREHLAEAEGEKTKIREHLEKTVNDTTQALRDAKADMNESGREKAFNNALETMQRLFPGVHGRLSDLCKPTQARYREAIAVVFGKMMDAIVVDNQRTGSNCIRYLKDQRVGMATFIPIDDVRPRPVDESLRRLGGTARLVVDVVKNDDFVHKAILYAAGNAVVCDTLDEARRHRYGGGRKIKICSLDGTLINKAGFMTGGFSRGDMNRARKWDRAEIETLKRKRQDAQRELQGMDSAHANRQTVASIAERIDGLQRRLSILRHDHSDYVSTVQASERDLSHVQSDLGELSVQLRDAVIVCRKAEDKLRSVEGQLHGLENDLFGDFARRHGIENVQQFEEQFVQKSQSLRQRKLDLETKEVSLRSSLANQKSVQNRLGITRLEKRIEAQMNRKAVVQDSLESLRTKRAELESRSKSVAKEIEEMAAERDAALEQVAEKRQDFRKETEGISERKKELTEKRTRIKQFLAQRLKLLTAAKVSQIEIPTLEGNSDDEDDNDSSDVQHDEDGDAVMTSERNNNEEESDPAAVHVNLNITINYSSLSRKLKAAATVDKQREMLAKFSETIRNLEQQLDGLAPNMRANEHMEDVQSKLGAIDKEAEAARERARKAIARFETVRQKRQDRFSNCFTHVADKISEVYKQLTKSTAYPMGGVAYLSLEQQDEPYLAGIKFNAMPPTKRFRDMEQLSGGERTVAALALLFAIHDFRPSPFFVLDEVDAALDNLNVGKVSTYIKSRAPELQTIVISLKDSFYERADALVGIFRDISLKSSRLLTLELTRFDDDTQEQPAQIA
eukprot:GFKZ01009501.1.p1 GENE.GFKZ01009501.1~~GFKZ01009501.1.p1  ORF type:complete len:1248 (-),score=264.28 GFKZ01009501.1:275-4018(-)